MIRGYIFGDGETVAKMGRLNKAGKDAVRMSVQRLTLRLLAKVKADKLSGQVLNVRTGRLRRSINQRVEVNGQGAYGKVGTPVKYGRIHEFGGTVSRPSSRGPGRATYPERSFLRSALREMEPSIRAALREALVRSMR